MKPLDIAMEEIPLTERERSPTNASRHRMNSTLFEPTTHMMKRNHKTHQITSSLHPDFEADEVTFLDTAGQSSETYFLNQLDTLKRPYDDYSTIGTTFFYFNHD